MPVSDTAREHGARAHSAFALPRLPSAARPACRWRHAMPIRPPARLPRTTAPTTASRRGQQGTPCRASRMAPMESQVGTTPLMRRQTRRAGRLRPIGGHSQVPGPGLATRSRAGRLRPTAAGGMTAAGHRQPRAVLAIITGSGPPPPLPEGGNSRPCQWVRSAIDRISIRSGAA